MLAGDAELLEPQRAGLEEPLEVAAHSILQLRGVRLHPLADAVQELHHADLGCTPEGRIRFQSRKRKQHGICDGGRGGSTLVGLGVERSRRTGEEEAARVSGARESHAMERERETGGGLLAAVRRAQRRGSAR